MLTPEQVFNASRLEILVPDERIDISTLDTGPRDWFRTLISRPQRQLAFFDERLYLLFAIRLPDANQTKPEALAAFLQRLQISLDASYIAPFVSSATPPVMSNAFLNASNANLATGGPRSPSPFLSTRPPVPLQPPTTPNPIPTTSSPDRQYARVESGVIVQSYTWGEDNPAAPLKNSVKRSSLTPPMDNFQIAWSEEEHAWIALYELHVTVTYLQTRVADPLLCLTVAATLRGKTLPETPQRQALVRALVEREILPSASLEPETSTDEVESEEDIMDGMEEVNLLDVLNDGLTFGSNSPLSLTTSRVGASIRRAGFSLPPIIPPTPQSTSTNGDLQSPRSASAPILRKAYRKTINTVSGIKVRMRNCLVPYVLPLHDTSSDGDDDEDLEDEAGGEERTVMLSIELENSPEAGAGFIVEAVEVTVGGEGARADLIGWGEHLKNGQGVFPLTLSAADQTNLLYAVSFLHPPNAVDLSTSDRQRKRQSAGPGMGTNELQRPVTIIIRGHPSHHASTDSFASRWNCILDLTPTAAQLQPEHPLGIRDALPTPASPFPASHASPTAPGSANGNGRRGAAPLLSKPATGPVAGLKHLSATGLAYATAALSNTINRRDSAASQLPNTPPGKSKFVPAPPSAVFAAMNHINNNNNSNASSSLQPRPPSLGLGTPTPRSSLFPGGVSNGNSRPGTVPPTPAFPSYADAPPPTPYSQFPIGPPPSQDGQVNEPRRERLGSTILPTADTATIKRASIPVDPENANMLVSVALLPPRLGTRREIFPLDVFALEIFLFNRSSVVRRCEVSYPERLRRRNEGGGGGVGDGGILPLDNRIRVGPLLPSTCQSIRMHFLALGPGVHSINMLTLTDVGTDYSMNLRSVMNIVVADPSDGFHQIEKEL